MGKGDKKSRRGKIHIGSHGTRRPRKKSKGMPDAVPVKLDKPVKPVKENVKKVAKPEELVMEKVIKVALPAEPVEEKVKKVVKHEEPVEEKVKKIAKPEEPVEEKVKKATKPEKPVAEKMKKVLAPADIVEPIEIVEEVKKTPHKSTKKPKEENAPE